MRFGPRKQRKEETKPRRPYKPREGVDVRAGRETVYLVLPAPLVAELRERWPNLASHGVRLVLDRLYGAPPVRAPLVPFATRMRKPRDSARLGIRLDKAWPQWAALHKVSLSSVVADALVRAWYLGE